MKMVSACPRGRALAFVALLAAGCAVRAPEPAFSTRRANVHIPGDQDSATLARRSDGSFVVAWESRRQDAGTYGVYGRVLDRDGVPASAEYRLNAWSPGAQRAVSLASLPDGSMLASWTSQGQDGPGRAVVARRFGPSLADAEPEIILGPSAGGDQYRPSVAASGSGAGAIAWIAPGPSLQAAIIAPGGEIRRARLSDGPADGVVLASTPRGFAAAWATTGSDGEPGALRLRFMGEADEPGPILELETGPAIEPAIDADGREIALAWLAPRGDGYAARARLFDLDGAAITPVLPLGEGGSASGASIALKERGVVTAAAIESAGSAGPDALVVRRFDRAGDLRDERRIAEAMSPLARASSARRLVVDDEAIAIAWSGDSGLGDSRGVNLTILGRGAADASAPAGVETSELAEPIELPSYDPARVLPQIPREVDGVGREGAFPSLQATGWTPPDMDLAVGPERMVAVVNVAIAIFDKDGTPRWTGVLDASGDPGLFEEVGAAGLIFDPEAHWDPHHQRYWVMANERHQGRGYFLVAVSISSDPLDGWHCYRIDVTDAAGGRGVIDSPNLAISAGVLYLSADFFDESGGPEHLVYMLDPTPLLAGEPPGEARWIFRKGIQSLGLAPTFEANPPAQYLIRATEDALNTTVVLHAITDPLGSPQEHEFTIPVPAYRFPGQPRQKGTSVKFNLFEPRFWSCMHRKNSVWAVHHVRPEGSDRTVVRWYRIRTNGWPRGPRFPELVQWGEIDAGDEADAFFPSIGVDDEGSLAITYARSGVDEYPSMWRALRRWDDPSGTTRAPELVIASAAPYTEAGRFGDYCKTQHDESSPGIFWGIHEYVNENGSWGTFVGRYVNTCDADLNRDGVTDIFDFLEFQTRFTAGDMDADFDGNGALNLFDFLGFQEAIGSC